MLFHAAAVVGKGLLAGGSADPASFATAALQQGPALQQQLQSTLLVSSRDATASALAVPALGRLATTCFLAAAHNAGINLAGSGILVRLSAAERQDAAAGHALYDSTGSSSDGEGTGVDDDAGPGSSSAVSGGWLSSLLQSCRSPAAAEQLGTAARQLTSSGLATLVTLRNAIAHLRPKLKAAGQRGSRLEACLLARHPGRRQRRARHAGQLSRGGLEGRPAGAGGRPHPWPGCTSAGRL